MRIFSRLFLAGLLIPLFGCATGTQTRATPTEGMPKALVG